MVKKFESDSDEEHYEDVKMEADIKNESKDIKPDIKNGHGVKGWVHRNEKTGTDKI